MSEQPLAELHLSDLETAIAWWQGREPEAHELEALQALRSQLHAEGRLGLSEGDIPESALDAWLVWYDSTPDSPCIAICSTAQGDGICKGCGRSFDEVQNWLALGPLHKRAVWRRITQDATAWRFNRYAERG